MAAPVLLMVLAAAAAHASWNAIAKAIPDQRAAAGLLSAAGAATGAVGVLVLPEPDRGSWPFIAVSSFLQAGYLLLLVRAYRYGEFSQVYPLARGMPPLLVTVVSVGLLGERLTGGQLAGVLLVSLALTALVFSGGRPRSGSGLGLAAATGVVIATYTLIDGVGVRHSGHPLSYAMWLFLLQGLLVLAVCCAKFGPGFGPELARSAGPGLLGGFLALAAYATVLWAQTRAPLPLVSAVRETSLLFAGVIGTMIFGERFSVTRLVATSAAVAGIVLVQAS
jgi:drug/metabolite transporter (DMT)-like permease